MSEKYQYIIITSGSHSATELAEFDAAAINTMKYASWNVDNTKYILKCSLSTPSCFVSHTRYNETEINNVITNPSWKGTASSSATPVDSNWDSSHNLL